MLAFWGGTGEEVERQEAGAADYFAYTDSENRLYLWKEGSGEPLLLTKSAFAVPEEENAVPYWESWEYWQEWDETGRKWVESEEKALRDVVWETEEGLCFPQNMRWESFGMQRGAQEREELLAYATQEELEDWVKVRAFCYDLYRQDLTAERGTGQEAERLAENVLFYSVDKRGAVWYCRAETDGDVRIGEEQLPRARCMLYRYDGTGHQEIGEIDGRHKEPYLVGKNGEAVIFYGMDDSLYRCVPGEAPTLLAERVDAVLYRDGEAENLIYMREGTVYAIRDGGEERELYAGKKDRLIVGALGKEGKLIFVMEAAEHVRYTDWIGREDTDEDADTKKLWELFEQTDQDYYPLFCTVRVLDISASPAVTVSETEGYVLTGPVADEEGDPRDVYYMEMIPADSFEKIPLSELLGDSLPGEVLYSYEYYLENYGESYRELALSWALEACWERDVLEKRSRAYAIGKTGIHPLDGLEAGLVTGDAGDYSADGGTLYLVQYASPELESDYRRHGHQFYYGYLENRYALDGSGTCRKVAELADETAVAGDVVFYSRNMGLEGYVSLYRADREGALASAADISLESLEISGNSDALLFLAEGLMGDAQEEIPVHAQEELWKAYRELDIERDRFGEEKRLRTLVLYQDGSARELGRNVTRYAFYGEDSVWMLQYGLGENPGTQEESLEEGEKGRIGSLIVHENGTNRTVTNQAVWMIKAGSEENSRSASWVFG